MRKKYLLGICLFILLMSMTGISASENVNQTDSLGLSIEDNFETAENDQKIIRSQMKMKYWELMIFMLKAINSRIFKKQLTVRKTKILFIWMEHIKIIIMEISKLVKIFQLLVQTMLLWMQKNTHEYFMLLPVK